MMYFLNLKKNIPGLLLSIDFEKAFDTVSWTFISKVLDYFILKPGLVYFKMGLNRVYSQMTLCPTFLILNEIVDKGIRYHHTYLYYVQTFWENDKE